jgi:hypothetical protein
MQLAQIEDHLTQIETNGMQIQRTFVPPTIGNRPHGQSRRDVVKGSCEQEKMTGGPDIVL